MEYGVAREKRGEKRVLVGLLQAVDSEMGKEHGRFLSILKTGILATRIVTAASNR